MTTWNMFYDFVFQKRKEEMQEMQKVVDKNERKTKGNLNCL
jgi:hypothetical protein